MCLTSAPDFAFVGALPLSTKRTGTLTDLKLSVSPFHEQAKPCYASAISFRSRLLRQRVTATSANGDPSVQNIPAGTVINDSDKDKRVSLLGFLFLFITYAWSVVLFIPMLIAHPIVMWRDRATRRFHDFIAMAWMKCSFGTVRVVPRIINPENVPPKGVSAVYVANHSSYLDIYSFAFLKRRIKYVSKAEIFKLPVVGWAMEMAGNIALVRMNRRGQMEAYRKMVAVIRNGLSLVIFPEGTRSATGKLRRFQAGAFRAAKQQGAPIIPVTILGTREVMPAHAWVPLRYPTAPISVIVHPAINSSEHSVDELRDLAFEAVDSALPAEVRTIPPIKHH